MFLRTALLCVVHCEVLGAFDGICGSQCLADTDCGGCGTAGQCSCPDGVDISSHEIECSCITAPPNPPADPVKDVSGNRWPTQWTAQVDSWTYGDYTDTVAEAHGKFYYDETRGRSRADWTPYITGKNAKQVWVADVKSGVSRYYVKTGAVCISFAITDAGVSAKNRVGMERSDWMENCDKAGYAHYVGREQVKGEWADHWSCRLEYEAVNQTIVFQNWHSLGLGDTPAGLPIRVTGGNSAPDSQKGSPRLNTVWYSNFDTSTNATSDDDFNKPNFGACVPVGAEEAKEYFGHGVSTEHVFSPHFHQRAHHLPHAKAGAHDLNRAKQPKPGHGFTGDSFGSAMNKLNAALLQDPSLQTEPCSNLSLSSLHQMQRVLFNARAPALNSIYHAAKDTRRMVHANLQELEEEQWLFAEIEDPELMETARDGACHELVMWYVHHLTDAGREDVKERLVLPLLPEQQHTMPPSQVQRRYDEQISCAICHVAGNIAI